MRFFIRRDRVVWGREEHIQIEGDVCVVCHDKQHVFNGI